ncbi:Spherulation-specific family 4-domain-containing protein [Mycena leptocephala]|nr:Spherulation-specific family 4-domain-containing protein [Mycena leptocephala]
MHPWHFLGIFFFNARLVQGLGVILPLRLDPGTNCTAWSSVSTAITAHTNTNFYIVINPDITPNSSNALPNANYRACIPTLRPATNPSTIVMGYVDTATSSTVIPYIDAYAAFDSSYRPDGIILDHVSATSGLVDTYKNYISHAKSVGFTFITLDPATAADAAYFPLVDLINTYEYLYSAFDTASLLDSASTPLSKQSVVLTNAPANFTSVVGQLANLGVGAVYITDKGNTDTALPTQWSAFVEEVAKLAPSGSPTGSSTATGSHSASKTESSTSPSSTEPSSDSNPHRKAPVGAIVGGVLGGVLLLGAVQIFARIRRRRNHADSSDPALAEELDSGLVATPFEEQNPTDYTGSSSGKGRRVLAPPSSRTSAPSSPSEPRVPSAMTERESLAIPAFPPPSYSDVGSTAS